jgi:hypothetical protein
MQTESYGVIVRRNAIAPIREIGASGEHCERERVTTLWGTAITITVTVTSKSNANR